MSPSQMREPDHDPESPRDDEANARRAARAPVHTVTAP
jgi:hypothetical protein